MIKNTTQWYASWFDTPYYHILYKNRDDKEAHAFMDELINYLNLPEDGKILDLACGKGRHSVYLSSLGYDVTGVDLSEKSIAYAKQFEKSNLHFEVHDMREPYNKKFDAIFNLFTSFGYFKEETDNLRTINAIKADLSEYGFGVIDFMNSDFVIDNLIPEDTKTVDGIDFHQKRYVKDGYLFKDISFVDKGETFNFQERVKAFTLKDFEYLFEQAGIYLFDIFGDYKLNKFHKNTSERLIMIFK